MHMPSILTIYPLDIFYSKIMVPHHDNGESDDNLFIYTEIPSSQNNLHIRNRGFLNYYLKSFPRFFNCHLTVYRFSVNKNLIFEKNAILSSGEDRPGTIVLTFYHPFKLP